MKVSLERCVLQRAAAHGRSFIAVRTLPIVAAAVDCRGARRPSRLCLWCPHFLDAARASVRCAFFDTDPVDSVMTPAANLVTVDLDEAHRGVQRRAPRQLLVTHAGAVVGLVDADGRARQRLQPVPIIPRTAILSTVAAILCERRSLVVVDREDVVGIVTRGDLRRAGVPFAVGRP